MAKLQNVDSSFTQFVKVNFSSATLDNIDFTFTKFTNITFAFAKLNHVNFSSAEFNSYPSRFHPILLSKIYLFLVDYGVSIFHQAKMLHTIFDKCNCAMIDFTGADLKGSSFHSALLNETDFTLANLKDVDFTNTTITDRQLHSALSIDNAKLPNGTLGQGQN